jgi:hypothetical protein
MCRRGMLFLALFGESNQQVAEFQQLPIKRNIEALLGASLLIQHLIPIEFEKGFQRTKT